MVAPWQTRVGPAMFLGRGSAAGLACGAVAFGLLARGYRLPGSRVKLRGIFWVFNAACDACGRCQTLDVARLDALHEEVLDAERLAFDDDEGSDRAKRELFGIQVAGVDAAGNRFTPLGRLLFSKDLEQRLRRRLVLATALASAPKPSKSTVAPVVIVGLPRTGSTLLHRLLAKDPAYRSPRYWELAHDSDDVSPPLDPSADDPRATAVQAGFAKLAALSPNGLAEFFKFHKVDAYEVEEVTSLVRRYFFDMETALLAPSAVAKRTAWLQSDAVDRTFAIRHLRRWLDFVDPDRAWILKSPALTAFLPEVLEVFPDATVVFTSRDPKKVAPSLCGLNEVACSVKYDYRRGLAPVSDAVLGRLAAYADGQRAFVAARPNRGLLLDYTNLARSPLAAAKLVYAHAMRPLAPDVEADMRRHLADNEQHKHGKPDYDLERYGLAAADVDRRFRDYAPFHAPP